MKRRRLKSLQPRVVSSAPPPAWRLFGSPNILAGEDRAAYDDLFARIRTTVKPVDTIEEMFLDDVVSLEWEVLRWRRLKLSLIQAHGCKALEAFLVKQFESNYDL